MITSLLEEIGNTPLYSVGTRLLSHEFNSVSFYFKVEYLNPALSVKDRTALGLVEAAEKQGKIRKGDTLVESSSGNLGHALAMICAVKGYNFICVLDSKTPQSNLNIMKAFGAKIEIVDMPDEKGSYQESRVRKAKEIADTQPNTVNLDQYNNYDAVDYHYRTTGPEIYSEIPDVDVIFGSMSTGSHVSGVAKFFKEKSHTVQVVGVEPEGSVISGGRYSPYLQNGPGLSFVPQNYRPEFIDRVMKISDKDAFETCRAVCKETGLFLGASSGALIFAMTEYSKAHDLKNAKVLGILPDSGMKYASTLYDDDWFGQNCP